MKSLDKIKFGLIVFVSLLMTARWINQKLWRRWHRLLVIGGAAGLRIEGVENLKATRPTVNVPIIGIVKQIYPDSPERITPF